MKNYLNTYQGSLWAIDWKYGKAQEFFSGTSVYNATILPFVASLNASDFQKVLQEVWVANPKKWWDNVSTSLVSKIKTLEQHLDIVDSTLESLSGNIENVLKDQDYVKAYNKLFRWKVYLSALTCSLYFDDYAQKIELLLDVTKKDKDVLDKMIFNLINVKANNPLDQKCIDDFKNYLIKTRESFFLLEQILNWFLNKIAKQAGLVFEDPLMCLNYQKSVESEMRTTLQELATQILSLSQSLLESSEKLKQLSKMGRLDCKSLANVESWDQGRWKDLAESLSKLNQILDQQPKDWTGQGKQKNEDKKSGKPQKIYEKIKSDEDLKRVEKESLEQIKETLKRKKHFPFYESVKNYFEEFYWKWWAKDKKSEGEILNEGW